MWFKIISLSIFCVLYAIRGLLWLTRLQQKEYRWDRLWHYLLTREGRFELLKIFPQSKDFTRTGLVRPKFTLRMITVGFLLDLLVLVVLIYFWSLAWLSWLGLLLLILVFVPFLVLLASIPTAVVFEWQVQQKIRKAQGQIRQFQPQVIGITGSYGKTSTKVLLKHLLQQKYDVYATQRSFNTRYSMARDIVRRYQGEKIAIIEYAAYKPGEIGWLARKIQPHWAIITGLTQQHLVIFGSLSKIIQAKSELIQALKPRGLVFINAEDEGVFKIVKYAQQQKPDLVKDGQVIAYSGQDSVVKLTKPVLNQQGQLSFSFQQRQIQTKLIGYRYLTIIQAAIAVAQKLNLSDQQIQQALESFTPPFFFVSFAQQNQGFWLLDDGRTSNKVAFADVIELTKELVSKKKLQGKKVLITSGIIDLGRDSARIHRELAVKTRSVFSHVFYTGEAGRAQFQSVLKNRLITQQTRIMQQLTTLTKQDLVVIEGWIPLWLQHLLIDPEI